jgi:uncharacterized protein (TIGR02391 family)
MDISLLENLLSKITQIQSIMVAVSTGGPRIQDKESEYKKIYLQIESDISVLNEAGLNIKNNNNFRSLWDWYGYWSTNLPTYASRRQYIREIYSPIVNPIESFLYKREIGKTFSEDLVNDLNQIINSNPDTQLQVFQISFMSLHPKIIQRCQVPFCTGQYDDAIFNAMKVVEEEVRVRISATPSDLGVSLISKAMNPNSPILILSNVPSEQEALHALFRGAIGSFKNPLSHRFLDNSDPIKTFECLALASLLMRMLDEVT